MVTKIHVNLLWSRPWLLSSLGQWSCWIWFIVCCCCSYCAWGVRLVLVLWCTCSSWMSFLVFQSSHWGIENWLLSFKCILDVVLVSLFCIPSLQLPGNWIWISSDLVIQTCNVTFWCSKITVPLPCYCWCSASIYETFFMFIWTDKNFTFCYCKIKQIKTNKTNKFCFLIRNRWVPCMTK